MVVDWNKQQDELELKHNIATPAGRRETGAVTGARSISKTTTSTQPTLHQIGYCIIYLLLHVIPGYRRPRTWDLDSNQESEPTRNNKISKKRK